MRADGGNSGAHLELDGRQTLPDLTTGCRRCELACTSVASGAALGRVSIAVERA